MKLSELVASKLRVTRRGRIHWALCPFHPDKHPSLAIYDEDSHYHCFACGAHGDAISWLMKVEKLPFPEAKKMAHSEAMGQVWKTVKSYASTEDTIPWPTPGVQYQEVALLRERLVSSRWSESLTMFVMSLGSPDLDDERLRLRHPYASDFTINRLRQIYGKPTD